MNLYLMRHGEASAWGDSDFDRVLTERGRESVHFMAEKLIARGEFCEKIITSPLLRARQTAGIVASVTGVAEPVVCNTVTPDNTPVEALQGLTPLVEGEDRVLVVMHQPIISRLINYLAEVDQSMGTADIAVFDVTVLERGCCQLVCTL